MPDPKAAAPGGASRASMGDGVVTRAMKALDNLAAKGAHLDDAFRGKVFAGYVKDIRSALVARGAARTPPAEPRSNDRVGPCGSTGLIVAGVEMVFDALPRILEGASRDTFSLSLLLEWLPIWRKRFLAEELRTRPSRDCDHCGEAVATEDLGALWYCKACFDAAVDGFADAYGLKAPAARTPPAEHGEEILLAEEREEGRDVSTFWVIQGKDEEADWSAPFKKSGFATYRNRVIKVRVPYASSSAGSVPAVPIGGGRSAVASDSVALPAEMTAEVERLRASLAEATRQCAHWKKTARYVERQLRHAKNPACSCVHAPEQHWTHNGCEIVGCGCEHMNLTPLKAEAPPVDDVAGLLEDLKRVAAYIGPMEDDTPWREEAIASVKRLEAYLRSK